MLSSRLANTCTIRARIDIDRRQIRGQPQLAPGARPAALAAAATRAADQIVERLPVAPQRPPGRTRSASGRARWRPAPTSRAPWSRSSAPARRAWPHRASRRARRACCRRRPSPRAACADRARSRPAAYCAASRVRRRDSAASASSASRARSSASADLPGEGLQQVALLRQQHPPRGSRAAPPAHPGAGAHRRAARTARGAAGSVSEPEPGAGARDRPPIAPPPDPRRGTSCRARRSADSAACPSASGSSTTAWHWNTSATWRTATRAMPRGAAGGGELAAHGVQQRRAPLARAGNARLLTHARHRGSR